MRAQSLFEDHLGRAARLAQTNVRRGLTVEVRLDPVGLLVVGRGQTPRRGDTHEYWKLVTYRDVELSDGIAITEAIKHVVVGLGHEFRDLAPPTDLVK